MRTAFLRGGYAGLALAFAALAAGAWVSSLVIPGLAVALLAGALLAFSDDDRPKWAGIALLVYFGVTVLAFVAASGFTINVRGQRFFFNDSPAETISIITSWITLVSPLMIAVAASAAIWDRERPPRVLLGGAIAGFLLVAVLTVVLVPTDVGDAVLAAEAAQTQGRMLRILFAVSAATGALGALWAAGRPESY